MQFVTFNVSLLAVSAAVSRLAMTAADDNLRGFASHTLIAEDLVSIGIPTKRRDINQSRDMYDIFEGARLIIALSWTK